jgi:hypothetical protein
MRLLLLLSAAVWCGGLASADAQSAAALVERMHAYIEAYEPKLSALVADEVFDQRHQFRPKFARLRRLESEIGFLRLPGGGPWLAQRSVRAIDGVPVPGAVAGLDAMLAMTGDDRFARARAIADGNARYNLGYPRTMNVPTLPLELLACRHWSNAVVSLDRQATGGDTATLIVGEREPGRIVLHDTGRFNRTVVRATIRVHDGALLRADVSVYPPGGGIVPHRIRIDFHRDGTLNMLVPARLDERYGSDGEGRGTATYRNYRRFQTSGRLLPSK